MTAPLDPLAPFDFLTAGRIRFGRGTAETAAAAVAGLGERVLLVRGRSVPWVDALARQLAQAACAVTEVTGKGEPALADVEAAVAAGRAARADVVVAVGGGAVIDLAKAAAALIPGGEILDHLEGVGRGLPLNHAPLPIVALPTTAGTGAEATKNAVIGVPDAGRKVSLRDDRMLPRLAIVDPALTDGTPAQVTLASGLDAVTQVIEPYLSRRANPLTDALCRSAIPQGLAALARLAAAEDPGARDHMAHVSLTGGIALANAGLGAVHGLAGVIGGRFAAPHGLICGRLLGPVLCRNRDAARAAGAGTARYDEVAGWIADAFGLAPQTAFQDLGGVLDALAMPRLGNWIPADAPLDVIAGEAAGASSMKANPQELSCDELVRAIADAL